ncbi:hypothetical protein DIPPA_64953 [Diplonema papillatum]|nr:hypothetical protein DIPPA_64953 [Diplonema papillatum]
MTEPLPSIDSVTCAEAVGNLLWCGHDDGRISIREPTANKLLEIRQFRRHSTAIQTPFPTCLATIIGDDEEAVWVGYSDGQIAVVDEHSLEVLGTTNAHVDQVTFLIQHGEYVFSASDDSFIHRYRAGDLKPAKNLTLKEHKGPVKCLASTGEVLLSAGLDMNAVVWSAEKGSPIMCLSFDTSPSEPQSDRLSKLHQLCDRIADLKLSDGSKYYQHLLPDIVTTAFVETSPKYQNNVMKREERHLSLLHQKRRLRGSSPRRHSPQTRQSSHVSPSKNAPLAAGPHLDRRSNLPHGTRSALRERSMLHADSRGIDVASSKLETTFPPDPAVPITGSVQRRRRTAAHSARSKRTGSGSAKEATSQQPQQQQHQHQQQPRRASPTRRVSLSRNPGQVAGSPLSRNNSTLKLSKPLQVVDGNSRTDSDESKVTKNKMYPRSVHVNTTRNGSRTPSPSLSPASKSPARNRSSDTSRPRTSPPHNNSKRQSPRRARTPSTPRPHPISLLPIPHGQPYVSPHVKMHDPPFHSSDTYDLRSGHLQDGDYTMQVKVTPRNEANTKQAFLNLNVALARRDIKRGPQTAWSLLFRNELRVARLFYRSFLLFLKFRQKERGRPSTNEKFVRGNSTDPHVEWRYDKYDTAELMEGVAKAGVLIRFYMKWGAWASAKRLKASVENDQPLLEVTLPDKPPESRLTVVLDASVLLDVEEGGAPFAGLSSLLSLCKTCACEVVVWLPRMDEDLIATLRRYDTTQAVGHCVIRAAAHITLPTRPFETTLFVNPIHLPYPPVGNTLCFTSPADSLPFLESIIEAISSSPRTVAETLQAQLGSWPNPVHIV